MKKITEYLQLNKRTDPGLWDFNVSGKIVELTVTHSLSKTPEKYRLGMIQVGKLIHSLRTKFPESLSIQVFPNFLQNDLAATLRFDDEQSTSKKRRNNMDAMEELYPSIFNTRQVKETELEEREAFPKNITNVLLISSYSENPFIWLQTGHYIEKILSRSDQADPEQQLHSKVLESPGKEEITLSDSKSAIYPQAIIFKKVIQQL